MQKKKTPTGGPSQQRPFVGVLIRQLGSDSDNYERQGGKHGGSSSSSSSSSTPLGARV